jgi:hypothetical protein
VCCASEVVRTFVLRVPEVVEAVVEPSVKKADSVVWHILLSLVSEDESTAARYYETGCASPSRHSCPN